MHEAMNTTGALDAPAGASKGHPSLDAGMDETRRGVERAFEQALSMQAGFPAPMIKVWAKILFSAVQPWLSVEQTSTAASVAQQGASAPSGDPAVRLDAVQSFCELILRHGDDESMPNAFALEQFVADWDRSFNQPTAALVQ